jgi:hypothetical protein
MSSYQLLWQNSRSTSDTALSLCAMRLAIIPAAANAFLMRPSNPVPTTPWWPPYSFAQSDTFFIALTAFAGPRHPKNCNVFASSAFVASKNFSNSFVARDGSRRMSCRSPSKGERSGTTNTRSFRYFLPFDHCRT